MENNDFASMLEESFGKKIKKGDKVTGEIVSIVDDKTIAVSLGTFTEGIMHLDHFTKDKNVTSFNGLVNVGDTIEATVTSVNEDHIYLSHLNQLADEEFKAFEGLKGTDEVIKVTVVSEAANNAGFVCKYNGVQAFLPKSLAGSAKVGEAIDVKIIEVEESRKKLVVSRKAVEQDEYQANRQAEYEKINVGDVLKGTIIKVEKYGALVKFNFVTGLLKVSEVSHDFIDITKELNVGDEIEVKVLTKENNKLELSRKALVKSSFELFAEAHTVGETIKGTVANKLPAGLLIEVAPKVKGLLHRSEYSHNPNDNYASYVKIGDEVEVAILTLDKEKERIGLSRKALMDNPWKDVNAKVGDKVEVTVNEIVPRGLRVSALGVDGFVPMSEASTERIDDLTKYFNVGDKETAEIIEINPKEWKLRLSIKRVKRAEFEKEYAKHMTSEEATTTIGDVVADELKK
ncbi:small subunit ribosomal protein S1 [Anaeroplasma bactoclasticum]|jgi:small subunit ribosomal protein S1|uniref:Small subunit ribosomal protein S1 n=1 Tax=Anaeroplasma bactoclasticum TaxID=2088 RepID=A0A397S0X9_9MOLU|nr:S1 RNA-binding domain-containing protein [Anaeroplasma bactoclasticum]RIA78065.1 small subunit ribosomal protein S1 [Anaeroplasma bactoclasticum]